MGVSFGKNFQAVRYGEQNRPIVFDLEEENGDPVDLSDKVISIAMWVESIGILMVNGHSVNITSTELYDSDSVGGERHLRPKPDQLSIEGNKVNFHDLFSRISETRPQSPFPIFFEVWTHDTPGDGNFPDSTLYRESRRVYPTDGNPFICIVYPEIRNT